MRKMNIILILIIATTNQFFYSCNKLPEIIPVSGNNKPPVANAGPDQEITLPANTVELDGSAFIVGPGASRTTIRNLFPGTYLFGLAVRDNGDSIANDTVEVKVHQAAGTCDISDRPNVTATLTQVGALSFAGTPQVVTYGNKIFFAVTNHQYAAVDIYDVNDHSWQRVSLSQARTNMAIVACENKIFFAGGNQNDFWYDIVDIYDITTNTWTVAHLSEPKCKLAAASIGDKVFFAGGITEDGWNETNRVDIYDISDDSWSFTDLTEPKIGLSTVTAYNKIYFAGGWDYLSGFHNPMIPLKTVDIYDASSDSWSSTNLNFISGGVSGIANGNAIYWGGRTSPDYEGTVEKWNTANGMITSYCLSYPRNYPTAISKSNEIIFFTPGDEEFLSDQFDIYNTLTGKWSIGTLDQVTAGCGIISVNNVVYVAGGKTSEGYSDKVYVLNW
jgi:N-acetylneuraminic acid mutarotase